MKLLLKAILLRLSPRRSQIVRSRILNGEPRIDGRTVDTVRALDICTGVLPRTHGSAIFAVVKLKR